MVSREEQKLIVVDSDVKEALVKLKVHPKQPFNDVIRDLLSKAGVMVKK